MKILLIINGGSGKMKVKQHMFDLLNIISDKFEDVTVKLTKHRMHATEIIKNTDLSLFDAVACCGGDGTLNEVINGVMESNQNCTIGYIPTGSTNDFANSIGIPVNITDAANLICQGSAKTIDIGYFNNEKRFTYIASFGLFTAVSYNTQQSFKNTFGHMAYVLEGIKDIGNIKTYKVKAESDGQIYEGEYIFGAVTNSTRMGGFSHLSKAEVDFSDGLLEVLLVKKPTTPNDLAKIILAISNNNHTSDAFDFFKTSKVTFTFEDATVWSLDGEACPTENTVEIIAENNAINIIL